MRVLRLGIGDFIGITNGNGLHWEARIIETAEVCTLEILSTNEQPKDPDLHMAVGILQSSDRMEWMVEKLTELGATRISFLALQRCERKKINTERLQRASVAALKQSGRARLPEITGPLSFGKYLQHDLAGLRLVGYLPAKNSPHLLSVVSYAQPVSMLIGPEGDLTGEEFQTALDNGFQPISLGSHVLRTETAAVAACCLMRLGTKP